VFQTHVERREPAGVNERNTERQLNDCEKGVLGVLTYPKTTPHRPLTDRERVLLVRWCGTDNHPIVLEAVNLFNATIVAIERAPTKSRVTGMAVESVRRSRSHQFYKPTTTVNDEYILQDRYGDYVEKVESGDTETVKMNFIFTKDIAKAKRFSYDDLWSPLATTSIGGEFTHGYGGGRAIKVSGS
jgi:hypothetical protein